MTIIRDRFDFDIGYLLKSPCRECPCSCDLPQCAEECRLLDRIQVMLAKGISCTGRHPFMES